MNIKNTFIMAKKVIFASSIGKLLKMYSFSLLTMLLPTLILIFFLSSDPLVALFSIEHKIVVNEVQYPEVNEDSRAGYQTTLLQPKVFHPLETWQT